MRYQYRKHPRLKNYDYSKNGCYFVTICVNDPEIVLSKIVGRGLAPAICEPCLTKYGKIAEEQLFDLENRFQNVKIDEYVIMPDHIHLLIVLREGMAGASPRPTVCDVVRTFKSLTTRICNRNDDAIGRKIFQTSFYDVIIRNHRHYMQVVDYVRTNPEKWNKIYDQGGIPNGK